MRRRHRADHRAARRYFATRRTYRGANILNLWMAQTARGYETAEWMTFKQAIDLGACVRKGEHGTPVFFVSALEREEKNAKGELIERHVPFWKSFAVFNIAQVDGLPERLPVAPRPEIERLASVEAYLAAVGATVRLGGDRAFYSPATDSITLPRPEQFESVSAFYATALHEHAHWSGAASRLAREFGKRFGDNAYAFEELVAELSAAFLCAELEIPGPGCSTRNISQIGQPSFARTIKRYGPPEHARPRPFNSCTRPPASSPRPKRLPLHN
jgi:antirestriction protein ArdC